MLELGFGADEFLELSLYQIFVLYERKIKNNSKHYGYLAEAVRAGNHANEHGFKEFLTSKGIEIHG